MDGSRVKTAADWERRRTELRGLFLQYEYGRLPSVTPTVSATEDLKRRTPLSTPQSPS